MTQQAKLFMNGRSQAVRLPAAFRFDSNVVYIRKDPETGDVILSQRPDSWDSFFEALQQTDVPAGFLDADDRGGSAQPRDPFEGWEE